jgi:preprotein translocase subunit SecE
MVKSALGSSSKSKSINNQKTITPQQFINQSIAELKKVVWPTRKQVVKLTAIVIGVSVVTGFFIGGLDFLFTKLMAVIIK